MCGQYVITIHITLICVFGISIYVLTQHRRLITQNVMLRTHTPIITFVVIVLVHTTHIGLHTIILILCMCVVMLLKQMIQINNSTLM